MHLFRHTTPFTTCSASLDPIGPLISVVFYCTSTTEQRDTNAIERIFATLALLISAFVTAFRSPRPHRIGAICLLARPVLTSGCTAMT